MAITITQQPREFASVYNDMTTIALSDNLGQDSFSYIMQVYDLAGTTLLSTQRIAPEFQYGYGLLNVGRILEGYLSTDFFINLSNDIKASDNSFVGYTVKIGEEYDVSNVLTQFLDLATFNDYAFNAALLINRWIGFDISDYEFDGTTKKFLTDAPSGQRVTIDDKGYTSYYNETQVSRFIYRTYDSLGVLIQTGTIDASGMTSKIGQCPSAPESINSATLATGTQPLISSSVASYTIQAGDLDVGVSELLSFNVVNCHRGRVHFLNDLDGFDAFNFTAANKSKWEFKKDYYKQNPNRLSSDGTISFAKSDREWVQYYTNQKETLTLVSDWITDEESIWLRSMLSSPEIYLELGGDIISLKGIKQTSYDIKEFQYSELFNIEVELEFSIDNYRQRG